MGKINQKFIKNEIKLNKVKFTTKSDNTKVVIGIVAILIVLIIINNLHLFNVGLREYILLIFFYLGMGLNMRLAKYTHRKVYFDIKKKVESRITNVDFKSCLNENEKKICENTLIFKQKIREFTIKILDTKTIDKPIKSLISENIYLRNTNSEIKKFYYDNIKNDKILQEDEINFCVNQLIEIYKEGIQKYIDIIERNSILNEIEKYFIISLVNFENSMNEEDIQNFMQCIENNKKLKLDEKELCKRIIKLKNKRNIFEMKEISNFKNLNSIEEKFFINYIQYINYEADNKNKSKEYKFIKFIKDKDWISTRESISYIKLISKIEQKLIKFILSPDLYYANEYKELIKIKYLQDDKNNKKSSCEFKDLDGMTFSSMKIQRSKLKFFVILSNRKNFFTSVLFFLSMSIINIPYISNYFWNSSLYILLCAKVMLSSFIIFHIISRVYEVISSFYKDTVYTKVKYFFRTELNNQNDNKCSVCKREYYSKFYVHWKGTSLRKPERITLAVWSYVEMVIWFAILYNLIANFIDSSGSFILTAGNLFNSLLYSCSVMFFNFSYEPKFVLYVRIAHVIQVLTSIVLVVLSLATYLGDKDDMDEEEINDFLHTRYYNEYEKLDNIEKYIEDVDIIN